MKNIAACMGIAIVTVIPTLGLFWIADQIANPMWSRGFQLVAGIVGASCFVLSLYVGVSLITFEKEEEAERALKEQERLARELTERLEERGF